MDGLLRRVTIDAVKRLNFCGVGLVLWLALVAGAVGAGRGNRWGAHRGCRSGSRYRKQQVTTPNYCYVPLVQGGSLRMVARPSTRSSAPVADKSRPNRCNICANLYGLAAAFIAEDAEFGRPSHGPIFEKNTIIVSLPTTMQTLVSNPREPVEALSACALIARLRF